MFFLAFYNIYIFYPRYYSSLFCSEKLFRWWVVLSARINLFGKFSGSLVIPSLNIFLVYSLWSNKPAEYVWPKVIYTFRKKNYCRCGDSGRKTNGENSLQFVTSCKRRANNTLSINEPKSKRSYRFKESSQVRFSKSSISLYFLIYFAWNHLRLFFLVLMFIYGVQLEKVPSQYQQQLESWLQMKKIKRCKH